MSLNATMTLNHLTSLHFNSLKLIKYFISECIFVPKIRDLGLPAEE